MKETKHLSDIPSPCTYRYILFLPTRQYKNSPAIILFLLAYYLMEITMTISTQDSKVNYQGNGQTKVFQIPFPFLENNQIYVQKKDAQGNLINYTYATDYMVTGAGEENGGSVTLNVAPEQGSTISIYRDVPLTQEVDYRENEIFPAETHEEALDKLTMEVQQIQEQLDRSVKVDRFSDVDPDIIVKEGERV